jgi:hypothetical protein
MSELQKATDSMGYLSGYWLGLGGNAKSGNDNLNTVPTYALNSPLGDGWADGIADREHFSQEELETLKPLVLAEHSKARQAKADLENDSP